MIDPQIVEAYSQKGGDLPYFVGAQQEGGGWLRTIGRFAFPILRRLLNVATNTAEDVLINKKPVFDSLSSNAVKEVKNVMTGKGFPNGPTTRQTLKRKRKLTLPPLFNDNNNFKRRKMRRKKRSKSL